MNQSNRTKILLSSTLFLLRLQLNKNKQKTHFCQMKMIRKMKKSCRKMKNKMNSKEIYSRLERKLKLAQYFIKPKITNVQLFQLSVRVSQPRNILVKNKHLKFSKSRIKRRMILSFNIQQKMKHHWELLISINKFKRES